MKSELNAMAHRALTRKECENEILHRIIEIQQLYKRYHPNGVYLSIAINDDYIAANNAHWGENDKQHPLDFYVINGEKGSCVK